MRKGGRRQLDVTEELFEKSYVGGEDYKGGDAATSCARVISNELRSHIFGLQSYIHTNSKNS